MSAALTIAVLFMVSATLVRVAAVALRHTGVPDDVARFQCISALSGTGFTTSEAEQIVNYPLRRRIITCLMFLGNLGLASVAATFIVAFIGAGFDARTVLLQGLAFVAAIGASIFVMTNSWIDRVSCSIIGALLRSSGAINNNGYHRLYQLSHSVFLAEHKIHEKGGKGLEAIVDCAEGLTLIGGRKSASQRFLEPDDITAATLFDTLIFAGAEGAHDAFAARSSKR